MTSNLAFVIEEIVTLIPDAMPDLVAREREFDESDFTDFVIAAGVYQALADEYRDLGYFMAARRCERKADRFTGQIPPALLREG